MYQEYGVGKRFFIMSASRPISPTGLCVAIGTAKLVKIFNITMESPHFQIKKLLCRRLQFMQNSRREDNFSSR